MAMQTMDVQVQRSTILAHGIANADPQEVHFNIFDRFATNIHIATIYAFTPPTPSNYDIIQGLVKVLEHFPLLTSRLAHDNRGRSHLVVGGDGGGALVVEATVDSELADHMPIQPSPNFLLLHPSTENPTHLFQVQINRFKCGGLVIGASAYHKLADGRSMSNFFAAWGQAVRGVPIDPLPIYDKSWLKPRSPPKCEFKHWGLDFLPLTPDELKHFTPLEENVDPSTIKNLLLHYSPEFINNLKAETKKKFTRFEILLAYIWRKITEARRLEDAESSMIRISVNGRPRLRPPVPNEYFGNLVVNAYPKTTAGRLLDGGLEDAAKVVHDAIAVIDKNYLQSFMDFGVIHEALDLDPVYDNEGNLSSPNIEVDSWMGFLFQDVDFGGGGKLSAFLPTWVPVEGLVIFIPAVDGKGGVDVFATMLEEHAARMMEISHSIN